MPAYEFECLKCGEQVMLIISISEYEKEKYKCPECGSKRLERLVSPVQVVTSKKS
jgi:putative FmdB family regulatory protein